MTQRQKKATRFEYRAYFALIFLVALPFAAVKWAWRLVAPKQDKQNFGVIKRAREQASIVTPMIFSA